MTDSSTELGARLVDEISHLRRFCFSLTRSAEDTDDIVQIAIEKALDKGVPDNVTLRAWLFRLCRNHWIDEMRKKKTRTEAVPALMAAANDALPAERVAGDKMLLKKAQSALENLPEKYRDPLALVSVGGLSYKQASEELSVPIGTIMSRVARGRAMIAKKVGYHDGS